MIKFLYKNRILLFCLAIPYFCIILLAFVKVDYSITTPATINQVEEIITIENSSKLNGTINVTSVYSYDEVSLLSYLLAHTNKYAEVDEIPDYSNISYSDLIIGGTIQKNNSIYNAIIAGYNEAGYELNYKFDGYYVVGTFAFTSKSIGVGDKILSVNGIELTPEYSFDDACNESRSPKLKLSVIKYQEDAPKEIEVEVGIYQLDGKSHYSFGINTEVSYIPENTDGCPKFNVLWDKINSIGGSGGLLQSFYIYESLTGGKLSNGLTIAGTGTIDKDGNVGHIGGIKQKIITAEFSNVDIFIVPVTSPNYENDPTEVNYIEAMEGYNTLNNPNIKLIPVWSLKTLIDALTQYHGGAN